MEFFAIISLAIIIEGITEYIKQSIPQLSGKTGVMLIITIIIGIGSAVSFGADLFALMGMQSSVPFVGEILTGILCARGSNYIYDLIGKFTER